MLLRTRAIGLISLLPISFVGLVVARSILYVSLGYEVIHGGVLVPVFVASLFCTVFLLIFFWRWIHREYGEPQRERLFMILLWGNAFVFPWFWYRYSRKAGSHR